MAILDEPHCAVKHHRHHDLHKSTHHVHRKAEHIHDGGGGDHCDSKRRSAVCTKCGKRLQQIMRSHHTVTCRPVRDSHSYHDRNYSKLHPMHRQKLPQSLIDVKSVASQAGHCAEAHALFGKSSACQCHARETTDGHPTINRSYSSDNCDRQALSRKMENILVDDEKPKRPCHTHRRFVDQGHQQRQHFLNTSTQSEASDARLTSSMEEEGASFQRQVPQNSARLKISNSYTQTQEDVRTNRPIPRLGPQSKDCADAGRRIWQTLFEATEPGYESSPPAKLSLDLSLTNPNKESGEASPNPYSSCWSKTQECPTTNSASKRLANRLDSESLVDGKFIRMKFGKKVKLVQIPERTVDPENDEVQVLVRHGKSVLWRKYKTFEHD